MEEHPYELMVFTECCEDLMKEFKQQVEDIARDLLGRNDYTIEVMDASTGEYFEY